MKQMNTVRTLIYGTIHMDSDRDKEYIKYSSFLVREGLSYAIRGFDDIISSGPKEEGRGAWKYIIQERNDKYEIVNEMLKNQMSVELYFNEYDEVKITLYKDGMPISTMQRIAISKVELDEEEEGIQFVLERMPSRMIRLQLKPYLALEMGPYWEVCDDCE